MSEPSQSDLTDDADGDVVYEVDDGDHTNVQFDPIVPGVMQSTPSMALMALKITSQPWNILGHGKDPNVAASNDMTITVERVTALFLIRIVAIVCHRNWRLPSPNPDIPKYGDISTTQICTEALKLKKPWPKPITATVIQQIRRFVRCILEGYNEVHYHSFEHAYHVTISLHKLMDMMLMNEPSLIDLATAEEINLAYNACESFRGSSRVGISTSSGRNRKTYGLKNDPLMTLAMLFSAIVHDVEHRGVPNRQLVQESHELAILYNDQSVAEQRSLAVAFSHLMKDEFQALREVMFENADEYRRFRKAVITTVLATDIASPERTQLVKSKWKEAFGETSESVVRKKLKEISRRRLLTSATNNKGSERTSASLPATWKGRQNSKPSQIAGVSIAQRRRGSNNERSLASTGISSISMISDLTYDPALATHHPSMNQMVSRDRLLSNIHDDESDEESTVATPESHDGLEPLDIDDYLDMESDKYAMSMPPPLAASLNDTGPSPTPMNKRGNARIADASEPEDRALPVPSMPRGSTESFVPRAIMTPEKRSSKEAPNMRNSPRINRRSSNPESVQSEKSYSVRLSIRRSMDLTGESIHNFSRSTKTVLSSYQPNSQVENHATPAANHVVNVLSSDSHHDDEEDELKTYVVMEHLIRAADIAANLQGWQQMKKWSNRLFFELKATHENNRGEDPQENWFENQIAFLESYIMPLSRRLNDMGVFGPVIGPMFGKIVHQNREQWFAEGRAETAQIVQEWQISKGEKHKLNEGW